MIKRLVVLFASLLAMATLCVGVANPAAAASGSYNHTCFGYTGTFQNATTPYGTEADVVWHNGTANCFGISPGRHIFDTSPGHPWYQIPGGGLADGLSNFYGDGTTKTVEVYVKGSNTYYCQTWTAGRGWAGSWRRC